MRTKTGRTDRRMRRLAEARTTVERAADAERADERERTAGAATRVTVRRVAAYRRWSPFRRWVSDNGLSITALALFLTALIGQVFTGAAAENHERAEHGRPPQSVVEYVTSGGFVEATAENWESEFFQMGVFVVLTALLYQRGAADSKSIDTPSAVDQDPREAQGDPEAPWPVRRGGVALALYRHSLSLALFTLFALSFIAHAMGGASDYNEEARLHGSPTVTTLAYLATSRFWFESFQNWQSEFLAVGVLVLLSIHLREHGSPQSKPVGASHGETAE